MDHGEYKLMMSAVKQYYEMGLNQAEIARKEYISKSKVCRLLKKALELGCVEFKVKYASETSMLQQQHFFDEFGLSSTIISTYVDDYLVCLNEVTTQAALDLPKLIADDDVIGV